MPINAPNITLVKKEPAPSRVPVPHKKLMNVGNLKVKNQPPPPKPLNNKKKLNNTSQFRKDMVKK